VIYPDWFCFRYITLWQIRMVLFFYVMATQVCICILYFIAAHNYIYSVYFMANHDCFHCVTLFTLWSIMIVFTVSLCLLYGQSWLFSLCHFVYSMANLDCFCFGYSMANMSLFSVLYPIFSVFLDCASFLDPSVFSNVILIFLAHLATIWHVSCCHHLASVVC
jgi:hypothetical protein